MNHYQAVSSSSKKKPNTAKSQIVGPSINDTTLSYVRRVRTSNNLRESQNAFTAFHKAFYEWSPSSIACIKPCDKAALDVVFYQSDNLDMGMPLNQGMVQFQKYIAGLILDWGKFKDQEDYFVFGDLQQLLVTMTSSTWDSYVVFYNTKDRINDRRYMYLMGCELPKTESIRSLVEEIRLMNEQRRNCIVMSIHGQMYTNIEMLHAYECFANTATLMPYKVHDATSQKSISKNSLENDLFDINTIYGIAGNDQQQLCDWLYICSYFHKYPSKLFGEMKYQGNDSSTAASPGNSTPGYVTSTTPAGHWPNIHTFVKAVAEKRLEIQQLFSDKMSYSNVAHALQTTLTCDVIIEAEVKVLMNCDKLLITASDVTNFRIVKLLHDSAQPLQVFVETCTRHNFQLIHSGETFRSLQMDVVKFYSFTDHHTRDDCIQFFHRLYDVFCPRGLQNNGDGDSETTQMVPTYMIILHKIDELAKVLSWLLPLTYVSYGTNVWQYVVMDMKWCGVEGYSRFYDVYQHVHNTLTEYSKSVSNERSILENILPVMRLFSIIGKCKDTCRSIQELLQTFQSNDNDDLRNCMNVPLLERYVYEVNSRIEAIRELLNTRTTSTITDDDLVYRPAKIPMLHLPQRSGSDMTAKVIRPPMTYGTLVEENKMRSWLDAQGLPSSVGDLFLSSGIRSMDDVHIFSALGDQDVNDTMSTLPKMDRIKLWNAMKALTSESSKKRKSVLFF